MIIIRQAYREFSDFFTIKLLYLPSSGGAKAIAHKEISIGVGLRYNNSLCTDYLEQIRDGFYFHIFDDWP